MKTVKEVAELTGTSIRALRYYDEIGILIPAGRSESGYRLYDESNIEKLNAILFLRELDVPIDVIKEIFSSGRKDYKLVLKDYRKKLIQKINRLHGLLDVVDGMAAEESSVCFDFFRLSDAEKVTESILKSQTADGCHDFSEVCELVRNNMIEGKAGNELLQIYGSRDNYLSALEQSTQHPEDITALQEELKSIYFAFRDLTGDCDETRRLVQRLEENTKRMFRTSNARYILLKVAKDYLEKRKNAQVLDRVYGFGVTEIMGKAIYAYYGAEQQ